MNNEWQRHVQSISTSIPDYGFKVKIPQAYADQLLSSDDLDPINLQFLPSKLESSQTGLIDPLDETGKDTPKGLLHKYPGRVLLTLTQACAIHCRYCFRRHFPYQQENPFKNLDDIIDYINKDSSIHEVIFSGGDPLMLSNQKLCTVFNKLSMIAHIKTIRFHTRMPMIVPSRIDADFLNFTHQYPQWQWVIVLHINHPKEWFEECQKAMTKLKAARFTLLNQSVLLKNINDNLDTLIHLSQSLWSNGIIPYYLHQLDPVKQAMHFKVHDHKAKSLYMQLQAALPGYLVPKLAKEVPGMLHKTRL